MKLGLFVEKPMGRFYHVDNSLYFCIDNQKLKILTNKFLIAFWYVV